MAAGTEVLLLSIGQQAVIASTPLVLAGVGELVAERSGVINVGIEGLLLTGCIAGFAAAAITGSGLAGVAAAAGAGLLLAGLFALATVWARADQIVSGTALNLLALGISGTAWNRLQEHQLGNLPDAAGFGPMPLGPLANWPVVGPLLFQQYALGYVTLGLAVLLAMGLRRTRGGLILRALGDAPAACDAAGIRVRTWRTGSVLFAGACAGAAGSYLSIMRTHSFAPEMTGGKGFVVLALVIFGRWSVGGLVAGCLLFGAIDSLQLHLQAIRESEGFLHTVPRLDAVPYQFFKMLPYATALAALALMTRAKPGPAYLGKPWPE